MAPTSSHVLVERLRAMLGLDGVGADVLTRVVGDSVTLRWADASVIAGPGSRPAGLFVVMSGAVEVVDGDEQVDELEPGATFGARQALHGASFEHRYLAAPECELLVIPKGSLDGLIDAVPGLEDRLGRDDYS